MTPLQFASSFKDDESQNSEATDISYESKRAFGTWMQCVQWTKNVGCVTIAQPGSSVQLKHLLAMFIQQSYLTSPCFSSFPSICNSISLWSYFFIRNNALAGVAQFVGYHPVH